MVTWQWKEQQAPLRASIKHWNPQLFSLCMGTGTLALALNQLPYQFRGLRAIAIVGFVIDLCLYATISSIFVVRVWVFPASTWELFNTDMEATTYLSCVSIASSTLIDLAFVICGSNWHGWTVACVVLWWIDVVIALLAGLLPYWISINHEAITLKRMLPSLLYPAVAMTSTAVAGAVCAQSDSERKSGHLAGGGLAVLMARLIEYNAPPAKKSPTLFVTRAPITTAGYAIELLGNVVGPTQHVFENAAGGQARFAGDAIFGFGLIMGLLLLGFATFWLLIGALEVTANFRRSSFTLNTWSAIYPIGTYALALNQLSKDFASPTFKVLTTIFTVINLLQWLWAVARTLPLIFTGALFLAGVPAGIDTAPEKRKGRQRSEQNRVKEKRDEEKCGGENGGIDMREDGRGNEVEDGDDE